MSEKTRFIPVRGTEADIMANFPGYNEGYLYFATDTKKIFLDAKGRSKIPMGSANSSIFYGTRTVTEDESTASRLIFNVSEDSEESDIEGSEMPNIGDLVLNSPDGCFYRVTQILSTNSFEGTRLTVAGSGGTGPAGTIVNLGLQIISGIQAGQTYVYGQSQNIVFRGDVDNGDTKLIYQVEVTNTYAGTTTSKIYGPFIEDLGVNYSFDLGSVLQLGSNSVRISVTSDNAGKTISKSFSLLNCVEMYLKEETQDFNPLQYFRGAFKFYCTPIGDHLTMTLSIYVDDVLIPALTLNNITRSNEEKEITIPAQTHGVHNLKAVLTCAESTASSSISYNICCIEDGNDAPIIWYNTNTPTSIINHDILNIEYMVYNPLKSTGIETHYYINNSEIPTSPLEIDYSPNSWLKWRVIGYQVGDNQVFTIRTGTTTVTIPIDIKEDTKRNLDIVSAGLYVNLAAAGRSNNENAQSRETWVYKDPNASDVTPPVTTVQFNNFNWYNNGWIKDDDGETCLRISNGASIEIPLNVMNQKAPSTSLAFEFVFKIRNVQNYSTLINTIVEDPESENPKITKVVSSTDGVWGSYYNNSVGFCMGTQEAFFKSKNALVSGRYKEDELIHLSFVVEAGGENTGDNQLIYIYINGINSGITKYNKNTDSLASQCRSIKINSDYCDIDLYNVRVYKHNLTARYVVQNYLADYNDALLYDMNNDIVDYVNGIPTINYIKMLEYNETHEEALLMPYMVIETTDANDTLPYKKIEQGTAWTVNIEFVNPTLDYEYENNLWTEDDLKDPSDPSGRRVFASKDEKYLHSCPSYSATGVELNVQGTSSQGYPIRNYKAKFKGAGSWVYTKGPLRGISISSGGRTESGMKVPKKWFMDSWIGENKTTLKADYMDSSGVHNTGFASFIKTLYSKHPLEDYRTYLPESFDPNILRTSIYGFPILLFHKTHDGQYKFLGRYNYNLDKGCDDSFGFCDFGDDQYIDVTSLVNADNFNVKKLYTFDDATESYVALPQDATYDSSLEYFRLDKGGDSLALNPDYDSTDPYSRQYLPWSKAAECWELEQNQGGRCSFRRSNFEEVGSGGLLTVIDDFEYRYHTDADSIDNALHRDHFKEKGLDFSGATNEQVNAYMLTKMSRFERFVDWISSTDTLSATNEPLSEPYEYNGTTYTTDSAVYRLAKFKKEFNQHLDREYCIIYYIMTELLLCYDSRGKNLMMATWGPHEYGGEDIWYPIFYDIDTQLGVNNSGVPYWDYYEEASKNGTFSTADSALWNNLWAAFESDIKSTYNSIASKLTVANLDGYYRFDPEVSKSKAMCGYRPIILHNVDEYQKYIAPSVTGFVNTSGESGILTDAFYYCLQGTRELQRALFLRNRFNYIESEWRVGSYSRTAVLGTKMRFNANNGSDTSDVYINIDTPSIYYDSVSVLSQDNYNTQKAASKDGKIYIFENNTYTEDTSNTYVAGTQYYIRNKWQYWPITERGYHPLDFEWDFHVTPYLKQYMSNVWDETIIEGPYASDGETVTIPIPSNKFNDVMNTPNFPQQLVYFGGGQYLSSFGDLSKKYIDELAISSAKRLKDLIIGSDIPGYINRNMNKNSFAPDDAAMKKDEITGAMKSNPNAKTLLEKVVLTNLTGLTDTIDFSGSEKLKELRALNTNVSSFILADGVQIAKLYLPSTITNLILKEPTSLVGILNDPSPSEITQEEYHPVSVTEDTYDASILYINTLDGYILCNDDEYFMDSIHSGDYLDYVENEGLPYNPSRSYYRKEVTTELEYPDGLYIEGLTNIATINANTVTHLSTINIVGGNMGYDSFNLLNKTVEIKKYMQQQQNLDLSYDKDLAVNLEKINWTPYRLVEFGEVPEDGAVYFLLDDHDILNQYNKVSNEYLHWTLNTLNGKVYEYDADKFNGHENDIVNLDLLDTFINDYQEAKDLYDILEDKNWFASDDYNFFTNTDIYAQGPTQAYLTGTIYINNPANEPIDEVEIKNYYHDTYYPKLTIHAANITKANVVKFVEVIDESTGQEYVWDTIKYSTVGANVQAYPELTEVVGSKLNYDFRGWATTYRSQSTIDNMTEEQIQSILLNENTVQSLLFANAEDQVIKLYAVYTIHSYHFTFLNYDDSIIDEFDVPTGLNIPIPTNIPHKDDSQLSLYETYKFLGYSRLKSGTAADIIAANPQNASELSIRSSQDLTFYALYEILDDVHQNVLDDMYLNISNDGKISVVSPYQLSGKIVIPNIVRGVTVTGINMGGFSNQYNITHIFLQDRNTSALATIGNSAFAFSNENQSSLIYFEMPKSQLVSIDTGGFQYCDHLFENISENLTKEFFAQIQRIGDQAFAYNTRGFNAGIFISANTALIGNTAFYSNNNVTSIYFGDALNPISLSSLQFRNINGGGSARNIFGTVFANNSHIQDVYIYTTDNQSSWDELFNEGVFGIPPENNYNVHYELS